MDGLGGEQRPVGFRGLVEQTEDAPGLVGVEPDRRRLLEKFDGLLVCSLGDKLIQRGAEIIGPGGIILGPNGKPSKKHFNNNKKEKLRRKTSHFDRAEYY